MNDRNLEMSSFLSYFQQLYNNNPDLTISSETIYHTLMAYGYSDDEVNKPYVKLYFMDWVNRFGFSKNLDVHWNKNQPRFLQFWNQKGVQDGKCFKLYLSLPKDSIYDCVNKIFDFINVNGFQTLSKVSDVIRSDDVVLRLFNEEDAKAVIDFINNDLQISQSAKLTNPFLVRDGVVGIAYDDMMSYNNVLSELMCNYFRQYRNENRLADVSLDDFRNYVSYFYKNCFQNVDGIKEFDKNFVSSSSVSRCGSRAAAILNYDQIYKVIMISLNENTKSNDIMRIITDYQNCVDMDMEDYYNDVLNSNAYTDNNQNDKMNYSKKTVDSYILYAIDKYGLNEVHKYLHDYLAGNDYAITRDYQYRTLFMEHVRRKDLEIIVGTDLKQYIYQINNEHRNSVLKEEAVSKTVDFSSAKSLLDDYVVYAISKYGKDNVSSYLNSYAGNNMAAITRDKNFRQLFHDNISPSIIYAITGPDLKAYVQSIAEVYENQSSVKSI